MNSEPQIAPAVPEPVQYTVPWKPIDNWVALVLLGLVNVGLLLIVARDRGSHSVAQSAGLILLQLAYLIPLIVVFLYRRVPIRSLGFGRFDWNSIGIGCGLLVVSYMLIMIHNVLLMLFGVNTQGQEISKIFDALESPVWLVIVGVVFAPIVEEIFFRGFIFQGFRARYGWIKGGILSAVLFGAAHLDPVAFIPTSLLGMVLTYMYHRTNSVWPGVILHCLVNAFGFCSIYVLTQFPALIPS